MAADMWLYWLVRGQHRAGGARLEALLAMRPAPTPTRAMALWALGFLTRGTGDAVRRLSTFEEARRVAEQVGGDRERAYALSGLGLAHLRLSRLEPAGEYARQALERMQRADDPMGLALCVYLLAIVAATTGRAEDLRQLATDAVEGAEQACDTMVRGLANRLLGTVAWLLGDPRDAEARLKEAVRIQDRIGHRWGMLTTVEGLALVAASEGRLERAALMLGAGAELSAELGSGLLPYDQVHTTHARPRRATASATRSTAAVGSMAAHSDASRSSPPRWRRNSRPFATLPRPRVPPS